MRLLHEWHDHGRDGAAESDAKPDRGTGQTRAARQPLPLRHSQQDPRCSTASCESIGDDMTSIFRRGGTGQKLGGREAVYRTELDGGPDAKKMKRRDFLRSSSVVLV